MIHSLRKLWEKVTLGAVVPLIFLYVRDFMILYVNFYSICTIVNRWSPNTNHLSPVTDITAKTKVFLYCLP